MHFYSHTLKEKDYKMLRYLRETALQCAL